MWARPGGPAQNCAIIGRVGAVLLGTLRSCGEPVTMSRSRRIFRRYSSAALAAVIAAPIVVALGMGQTAHAAPVALYPDLKTLPPRELRFDRADVTPELSGDFHNVLRFSNTTYNAGEGPLILNATIDPSTLRG